MAQRRGFRTISLDLPKAGKVSVYTSPRTADALKDIMGNMKLYDGVKLTQIIEAVYTQGHKDGAREAFDELDRSAAQVKKRIPHRKPGRPRGSAN